MKQLLILISFFLVFAVDAKNISYEIKDGDTLYSIARANEVTINELFKVNEKLSLSSDFILPGNILYIPKPLDLSFHDVCFTRIGGVQMHTDKSQKEVATQCLEALKQTDKEFSNASENFSNLDILYHVNKVLLEYGKDARAKDLYAAPIVEAANNGNISAAYATDFIDTADFRKILINKDLSIINDMNLSKNQKFEPCNRLLEESYIEDYDLLIYFYIECSDSFYDYKKNEYIKFDNKLKDLILSNNTKIVRTFEMYAISLISYHLSHTENSKEAFELTNNYVKSRCEECDNSIDLFNKYVDVQDEGYSIYFLYALYYLALNDRNNYFEVYGVTPEDIANERSGFFESLTIDKKNAPKDDWVLQNVIQTTYADYSSTTATHLMAWKKCDLASTYLDNAITVFKGDSYDNSNEEYFTQPLFLASCYLIKSGDKGYVDTLLRDKAIKYKNIAEEAKVVLSVSNPLRLALLSIVTAYTETLSGNGQNAYNLLKDLSVKLKDPRNYYFSGDLKHFELITSLYVEIYTVYQNSEWMQSQVSNFNIDNLIDPVELIQLKSLFSRNAKLLNIKVDSTNIDLNKLQSELIDNNFEISKSIEQGFDYQNMLNLYTKNKNLTEQILLKDEKIKNLTSPNKLTILTTSDSLNNDEFAYFYINSPIGGKVLLIDSSANFYVARTPSKQVIQLNLNILKTTIDPDTNYGFRFAKNIGSVLFPFISNENSIYQIPKGSTIYLYTDNLLGIPPSILVKTYNEEPSISDYERLITADWFINDFNFSTKLSYKNDKVITNYDKPFLGLGNSTTYEWSGLPNLTEVNSEITSLALSSYGLKEDLLQNKMATKEALLSKFKNSYKRIVISTHAVPSNWQGLIDEPSLVLNSRVGDYFLSPSEIIKNDIDTEMVVLSACNSSTNGFDDLYKSFLIAGAQSVVYSNWNLESKYAKEFTTTFFKELWLNEESKHVAIRNVSKSFINNYSNKIYAHPAYWGNFSIVYNN